MLKRLGQFKNYRTISKAALLLCMAAFFSGCSTFHTRPAKQMAYAEAAMRGAILANAESNPDSLPVFQLAKDSLSRARSYYRLKNFKECRLLAVRARHLAEEAEWLALRGKGDSNDLNSVGK